MLKEFVVGIAIPLLFALPVFAEDELTNAQTDQSIDHAAQKVRVLCED